MISTLDEYGRPHRPLPGRLVELSILFDTPEKTFGPRPWTQLVSLRQTYPVSLRYTLKGGQE